MRAQVTPIAAFLLLLSSAASGLAASPTAQASGPTVSASTSAPATARLVVRPVSSDGAPRPRFHVVQSPPDNRVDCRDAGSSPSTVSPNVDFCTPTAAYAVACWKSATPHQVLCVRDPSSKRLYSIARTGRFAKTSPPDRRDRAPMLLFLRDGTRCSIRDGGAWGMLQGHPHMYGSYSCDHHGDVWTREGAPHYGVNESHRAWTVRTASATGDGSLTVRTVRTAYFVGTHRD